MELKKLTYTLKASCKNEKLKISQFRKTDISRYPLRKQNPWGTFYYSPNEKNFDNLFFEHSNDYNRHLILNSPLKDL